MRKRKAFEEKPVSPHEEAERIIEASSQPVSTEAPDQAPDRIMKAVDEEIPEAGESEIADKDYYAKSEAERQGGVPADPPDVDPLPLQHPEKPRHPPKSNM